MYGIYHGLRRYYCKHEYNITIRSKTNFFFVVLFFFFFYRRGGFSRAIIYTSPASRKMTCYGTRARFFSSLLLLLFLLLLFIFYTAFIKNLLTIDFAFVSPTTLAIRSRPGGGGRGGNCFVRRSNKNYKTFIYLRRNYTRQRQ